MASESPEMLERLRKRFLRALSELSGGADEGKPAMVSEVAQGAGLDPERDPDEKALSERLPACVPVEIGLAGGEIVLERCFHLYPVITLLAALS